MYILPGHSPSAGAAHTPLVAVSYQQLQLTQKPSSATGDAASTLLTSCLGEGALSPTSMSVAQV